MQLRPGNAGSNAAADHVDLIDRAGASHAVVKHLDELNTAPTHGRRGRKVGYSIGFDLDARARTAITTLPATAWEPALDAAGEDAAVADLTGVLRHSHAGDQLSSWPGDMRVIAGREPIAAGKQVCLFEQLDGYRYQVIATNTAGRQVQRLQARHRVQPASSPGSPTGKETGPAALAGTTRSTPRGARPWRSASTCWPGPGY